MEHDSSIERDQAFGGGEQGVDVDLLDARLLDDERAEAHEEPLERGQVDGTAAADALEGLVDSRRLHHATSEGRVERREGQRAVLEHLDELAAGAKEENRAEL